MIKLLRRIERLLSKNRSCHPREEGTARLGNLIRGRTKTLYANFGMKSEDWSLVRRRSPTFRINRQDLGCNFSSEPTLRSCPETVVLYAESH